MKLIWILLIISVAGCNTNKHAAPVSPAPKSTVESQVGRFQTFNNLAEVALDTKTGQLCKTYDWHTGDVFDRYKVKRAPQTDPNTKYENAPLCSDIEREVPIPPGATYGEADTAPKKTNEQPKR
jgi:hypothetical protein